MVSMSNLKDKMYLPKKQNIEKLNTYLKKQELINLIIDEYKDENLTNNK